MGDIMTKDQLTSLYTTEQAAYETFSKADNAWRDATDALKVARIEYATEMLSPIAPMDSIIDATYYSHKSAWKGKDTVEWLKAKFKVVGYTGIFEKNGELELYFVARRVYSLSTMRLSPNTVLIKQKHYLSTAAL